MNRQFKISQITKGNAQEMVLISEDVGWKQPYSEIVDIIERSGKFILGAFQDNLLIGVAAAYCYPAAKFAFINEVIVHSAWRHCGIATRLLTQLINALSSQYPTLRLYATEMGRPLYEKLGFQAYGGLKFCNISQNVFNPDGKIVKICHQDLPMVYNFDERHFGARREKLLEKLYNDSPESAWCIRDNGMLRGFILKGPMSWLLQCENKEDMLTLIQYANHSIGTKYPILIWKEIAEQLSVECHFELTAMQRGNGIKPPTPNYQGALPDIG